MEATVDKGKTKVMWEYPMGHFLPPTCLVQMEVTQPFLIWEVLELVDCT